MIPGLNAKKMQKMMKQLGMSQEEIDAEQVIIKKTDGSSIIIDNPSVTKIEMQGKETFQISGDISQKSGEDDKEEQEKIQQDIETIIEKTGVKNKDLIAIELEKNNGDIAKTIMSLSK
jgi:nascent polypeptide-associated complex subunit alpha